MKSFDALDRELEDVEALCWGGEKLPFPILLDSTGETLENYGITAFPTTVLIDPDGKLVGEIDASELAAKLPPRSPLPLARRIARALDRQVFYHVDDTPLAEAIERLATETGIPIRIDEAALRSALVAPTDIVPLKLEGMLSLRSWLNLVLEAHRLTFEPGDDALLVVAQARDAGPPRQDSKPQQACRKRIEARLSESASFDFKDAPVASVLAHFERQTGENFILDPSARKAGRLDPAMRVTGTANDEPLGPALGRLLQPAGLTLTIRDELVVFAPLRGEERAPRTGERAGR